MKTMIHHNYESRQLIWEKRASVRARPRRVIPSEDECLYYYPIARQPICAHPIVMKLGEEARKIILAQSCYKFMNDVAVLETEVVNTGALMIANSKLNYVFPDKMRHDALTIIIDEAYHAYVAVDFMNQIIETTGIKPITLPIETNFINALVQIRQQLPTEMKDDFTLIAVCIGEHVLTKELISIGKDKSVSKTFSEVMADHVLDEGRHSSFFREVLTSFWANLPEATKIATGEKLPEYLGYYLESSIQKSFDKEILKSLELSEDNIEQVISDTYLATTAHMSDLDITNPIAKNLVIMLDRCGVLTHKPTLNKFKALSLLDLLDKKTVPEIA